ncbi:MAG: S-methyl-5'-thioadenosine phosphorylase [Candidatus Omnitrophota bacterium]|nr:S-methyl-5'-thioadenosine phosphorylase [Candidatus Omnitrophota bacterium]
MEKIGVIGGSGLYNLDGLKLKDEVTLRTPFGDPSDKFIIAEFEDKEVVFLPRHGKDHAISPSKINYRANIYGMKKLGVSRILSVSACGSLKEEFKPCDFVIPLQFVDRTNQARKYTFFDEGIVAHVSFAYPVCEDFAKLVHKAAGQFNVDVHYGGTYLNMEGPQFSTQAESNLYRSWGMDIIGMTNMAEARLAKEAELCYVTLAAVTDYDCWRQSEEVVTVDMILENLQKNTDTAKKILKSVLSQSFDSKSCACNKSLQHAIVTRPQAIDSKIKKDLDIIIGKYVS